MHSMPYPALLLLDSLCVDTELPNTLYEESKFHLFAYGLPIPISQLRSDGHF